MTAKKDESKNDAATPRGEEKADKLSESRSATLEDTPDQLLGTEDPRHPEPLDIAPAPSGDMDHLNPGVPGDLPNEQPAAVPTDEEVLQAGFKPSPTASVPRAEEEPQEKKSRK